MFRRFTLRKKEPTPTNSENDNQENDQKEPKTSETTMDKSGMESGLCTSTNNDQESKLTPSISLSGSPASTLSSGSNATVNRKNKPALEITVKKWDMSRVDRLSPKTPNSCLPGSRGEQERSQDFQESIQKISMEASCALDRLNELEQEVKYYRAMTGVSSPFEKRPLHLPSSSSSPPPSANTFHRNHLSSSGSGMISFLTSLPVKYSTNPTPISRSTSTGSGWSSTDDSGSTFSSIQSEVVSPSNSHYDLRGSCTPPSSTPFTNSCVSSSHHVVTDDSNSKALLAEELRDLRKKFTLYRHQLTEEKSLRRKAEEELEQCKQELEGLTQELFQEANEKVATERRIRFSVEEQLKEALTREQMHRRRLNHLQTALNSISAGRRLLDSSSSINNNQPLPNRQAVDLT